MIKENEDQCESVNHKSFHFKLKTFRNKSFLHVWGIEHGSLELNTALILSQLLCYMQTNEAMLF